ncbi:MAG: TetR/AcrR family transcriptional regulator [Rhizomicrobium sp.]
MPRALSEKEYSDFRHRLCHTASRLFVEKGLAGVTMRELAAALGVSAMTPYRYFRNKEEILATVRAQAFNQLADDLAVANQAARSNLDRLNALHKAYLHFALENPNRYKLMLDQGEDDAEAYPELGQAQDRCSHWLTDYVGGLVASGYLNGNPRVIAYTLWSSMHGAIALRFAGKLDAECDLSLIVETAHRALIAAFTSASPQLALS